MSLRILFRGIFTAILFLPVISVSQPFAIKTVQATPGAAFAARSHHPAVEYNGKLWVIGGFNAFGENIKDVWSSYDGVSWNLVTANAPFGFRYGHTAVVFNGEMWVIGGHGPNGNDVYNDAWRSADGINWVLATGNAGFSQRYFHASAVFDNKMWVMGGTGVSGISRDVWYSSDGSNWIQATAAAPFGYRHEHTVAIHDGKMFVIGGNVGTSNYVKNKEVWQSSNGTDWTLANGNAEFPARGKHSCVSLNGKLWVIGGDDKDGVVLNDVWYSEEGVSWTQANVTPAFPPTMYLPSIAAKNRIWIIGGHSNMPWNNRNDVWSLEPVSSQVSSWLGEGNANDAVGANHGTAANGTGYSPGKIGQAFSFDGLDDLVHIQRNPSLEPSELTVEAWVNPTDFSGDRYNVIIGKQATGAPGTGSGGGDASYALIIDTQGRPMASVFNGQSEIRAISSVTLTPGTWYHLAGTVGGGSVKLYLNGELVASSVVTGSIFYNTNPGYDLEIGTYLRDHKVFGFHGLIDQASLYNRVLSGSEVHEIFASANGNAPPAADAGDNISTSSANSGSITLNGSAADADGDVLSCRWLEGTVVLKDWSPVGTGGQCPLALSGLALSLGQHSLTLQVRDDESTASDEMLLTIDNTAPAAAAAGSGTYELGSDVSLGGTVADFDGDILHYAWSIGGNSPCAGDIATPAGGTPVVLPACSVGSPGIGMHEAVLLVTDGTNGPASSSIRIQIVDNTLPSLAPVANFGILWPPNHQWVDISIHSTAHDNSGSVTLSSWVSSNEPQEGLGDGDAPQDWTIPAIDQQTGIISLKLRAERSGKGSGRIYSITVAAVDASGNKSEAAVEVKVPHSKSKN